MSAILFPVGFLALFTALGAAPVALFGGRLRGRGALMPIAGCALAAVLLTDVAPLLPMHSAAWLVLLPAAALSMLLAFTSRRGPSIGALDLVAASALALVGALTASIPAIRAGTPGPRALGIYDALQYISVDDWLRDNRLGAQVQAADAHNLVLLYGHGSVQGGGWRIGADAINAAASTLMHASASETNFALLAALYGLGAAAGWFASRSLGLSVLAAVAAGAFALSAGFLVLVYETALGNLAGLVVASATIVCFYHGIRNGDRGTLALTGIAFAGLLALYPEFLLPTLTVAGAAVLVVAAAGFRGRVALAVTARTVLGRLALVTALTILLAPVPLWRTAKYLTSIVESRSQSFGIARPGIEKFLLSALGLAHFYEFQLFDAIGGAVHAFVLGLAVAFVVALLLSSTRRRPAWVALVAAPIVAALTVGIASGSAFSAGGCTYCRWKAWTFMLPFLGLGLGFAVDAGEAVLRRRLRGTLGSASPGLLAGLIIAAALVAPGYVLGSTDGRLVALSSTSLAAVGPDLRAVASAAGRATGRRQGLLLEGANAVPAPNFTVPGAYELLSEAGVERISLDARNPKTMAYLGWPIDPGEEYRPDYALVLSPFAGLRSGRRTLVRAGNYVLQRRAAVDFGLAGEGLVVDPRAGKNAIPWVVGPFDLWLASPSRWSGSILIRLRRPFGGTWSVVLVARGRPVRMFQNAHETICANVSFGAGRTTIGVIPTFETLSTVEGIPKVLGIPSIRAKTLRCTGRSERLSGIDARSRRPRG